MVSLNGMYEKFVGRGLVTLSRDIRQEDYFVFPTIINEDWASFPALAVLKIAKHSPLKTSGLAFFGTPH